MVSLHSCKRLAALRPWNNTLLPHYAVGRAFDSQLFHPVSECIWMHSKSLRRAVCALYNTARLPQHGADMGPLNFFQRLERSRWSSRLIDFHDFTCRVKKSF